LRQIAAAIARRDGEFPVQLMWRVLAVSVSSRLPPVVSGEWRAARHTAYGMLARRSRKGD
jgi:hypothetical protein